jgi:murein DD-endopeptidase MepM/ murein hydrolase activator NlpD
VRVRGAPVVGAVGCVAALCTAAVVFASDGDDATVHHNAAYVADLESHPMLAPPSRDTGRSDDLRWPLHGKITGRFGELRAGHVHEGIDIPMPEGTPIRAAGDGKVVLREVQQGYGNYTCIAHRTITTCYGHQSKFRTKLGAHVHRGEVIGEVGSTGDTSATHLHFEVRRGTKPWGKPMNPKRFLPHLHRR